MILAATLHESDAAAAKIVIERMSQAERFVFLQLPTRMNPVDIVRDVSGQDSVFLSMNLLLQTLAVIRKRRSFCECDIGAYAAPRKLELRSLESAMTQKLNGSGGVYRA